MRLPKRARYWIADLLNRRDDVCWSDTVCWVEFGHDPLTGVIGSAERDLCKGDGLCCYCGKFCDGRRSVQADFEQKRGDLPEPFERAL